MVALTEELLRGEAHRVHRLHLRVAAARAVADGDGDAAEHQVRTHIAIVSHEVQEAPGSEADRAAD